MVGQQTQMIYGKGYAALDFFDQEDARIEEKMRISKRGLPKHGQEQGDLFAVTQVVMPTNLTDKERELFKELAQVSKFSPRPHFE